MGVTSTSGQTSVIGTVQAVGTFAQTTHAVTLLSGEGTNQTVTLGTVPAGKKWHVVGIAFCGMNGSASVVSTQLKLAAAVILNDRGTYGSATFQRTMNNSLNFSYSDSPSLAEGEAITFVIPSGCYAAATAQIVEENE